MQGSRDQKKKKLHGTIIQLFCKCLLSVITTMQPVCAYAKFANNLRKPTCAKVMLSL